MMSHVNEELGIMTLCCEDKRNPMLQAELVAGYSRAIFTVQVECLVHTLEGNRMRASIRCYKTGVGSSNVLRGSVRC